MGNLVLLIGSLVKWTKSEYITYLALLGFLPFHSDRKLSETHQQCKPGDSFELVRVGHHSTLENGQMLVLHFKTDVFLTI